MEREAFRQRMQQYKQARESNPQLKYWDWKKENDLGYQLYKNNLPSNLQVETDDYDLYGAYESNMQPELNEDGTYHLGSRDPYTGRILKSKQHPTYQKAIESEMSAGYFPYEKNNVTYTKTYSPVDISGYADGTDKVTPQTVPMDNIDTFQYDPILKTYSRVKYKSYKDGGIVDEDPPQNTSERPITNFDPKGDPYNPTYGYNPGAGYVSNSDPLGSLYIEGALLNPVFKLAGNVVSNVARGLTKYSSKYVPEVKRTVQDKINNLFRREAEDKARTFKLYDDAIESRNRIIEDLYSNPAYMERARQIQNTYGDNYAQVYEDIINQYNTNYWNLPNPVIKQLDAKAKMQAKDAAVNRYITRRQPAGYNDFEYQINRNLTEIDYPTTRHELGHYVDFNLAKSSNPDYSNSMFAELKRDLSKQKNPLFPDKTDYYSKGTEQKSYMNTLREYMFKTGMINNIGDKVTSRQIKKAIRSLPKDMRSIEAAYLQFATPGQYTKWFNKIPLLGTYPIVNKQFQNYEEDKDKAREQR